MLFVDAQDSRERCKFPEDAKLRKAWTLQIQRTTSTDIAPEDTELEKSLIGHKLHHDNVDVCYLYQVVLANSVYKISIDGITRLKICSYSSVAKASHTDCQGLSESEIRRKR